MATDSQRLRSEVLRLRITQSERRFLQQKADERGLTVSEYVRRALFEAAPRRDEPTPRSDLHTLAQRLAW